MCYYIVTGRDMVARRDELGGKTKTTFAFDVFLSHNAKDKPRVRKLAERLRDAGLRVWFDEWETKRGEKNRPAIERGLEESRALVLCMSPAAFGSDRVSLERSTVLFRDPENEGRRFIPLLLADCDIPDALRRYRYVDYREENDAASEELPRVQFAISVRTLRSTSLRSRPESST